MDFFKSKRQHSMFSEMLELLTPWYKMGRDILHLPLEIWKWPE